MQKLLAGAIAGTVATIPMTVVMKVLQRGAPSARRQSLPPRQITLELARRAGIADELGGTGREVATAVSHFGYGGSVGALYPEASERLPGPPLVKGALFGIGVWAASYLGWLPAAGILRPATREPAGRNAMMVAAHVVWGAVTAVVSERLRRPPPRRPRATGGRGR